MKYLLHFLKLMGFPIIYLFILAITNLAINTIGNDLLWLKYILDVLVLGFYCLIIGAVAFKDGEKAYKTLHTNDVERRNIIATGEDRPLDEVTEYKPWKGFMMGLSACIPLLILLFIHTLVVAKTPSFVRYGELAGLMYMVVFSFIKTSADAVLVYSQYYFALIALPIFMLSTGIPYMLGARKAKNQYRMIEEKHRQIYGE